MGARVAAQQLAQRIGHRAGEAGGYAHGHGDADAVAEQSDVFDGDPPPLPGERDRQRPPRSPQALDPATDVVDGGALGDLGLGQRAEQAQQVSDRLGVTRPAVGGQVLQSRNGRLDHLRVEQLSQFDAAEQFGEQHAVQRERGRATLCQRAVTLVHERADVAEQQRRGEGDGVEVCTSSSRMRRCAMRFITSRSVGTS